MPSHLTPYGKTSGCLAGIAIFLGLFVGCGSQTTFDATQDSYYDKSFIIGYKGSPTPKLEMGLAAMGLGHHWRVLKELGTSRTGIANETINFALIEFDSDTDPSRVIKELIESRTITYAEPNHKSQLFTNTYEQFALQYEGINEDFSPDWFSRINLIKAFQLLSAETVDTQPIIAVMDSGIDIHHPALRDKIWTNPGVVTSCENDVHGCNTTHANEKRFGKGDIHPVGVQGHGEDCIFIQDQNLLTQCIHGTHAAGVIASSPQFNYGGVCPSCKILPIKIMDTSGNKPSGILDSSIVAGLLYIKQLRKQGIPIRVVNASFGKFQQSLSVNYLINELANDKEGVLFIAAAGNENTSEPQYPAAMDAVIAVSNIDPLTGARQRTSNYGSWIDIAAPGTEIGSCRTAGIRSAVPGGESDCAVGTSVSSPIVAGVAGLILSRYPTIATSDLRAAILNSADPGLYEFPTNEAFIRSVDGKLYPLLGAGIVDAQKALQLQGNGLTVGKDRTRITNSCGTIALHNPHAGQFPFFILLLPLGFVFFRLKKC